MPFGGLVDFGLGAPILGQKTAFWVLLPYLLNHFDISAHILTQGRSWAELVTLGGVLDFWVLHLHLINYIKTDQLERFPLSQCFY